MTMPAGPGQPTPPHGGPEQLALGALLSALDAVVCVDRRGSVLCWNPAAARLLGWDGADMGADACARLGSETLRADLQRVLDGGGALRGEHEIATADGSVLAVEATIARHDLGGTCDATLFLRDVTATKRTEQMRELEHSIARTLAAAQSGMEVAPALLERTALGLGFEHAELWIADADRETMRLACAWRRTAGTPFAEAAHRLAVVRGSDLAGMAWEIGEAVCIDDAATLQDLPRAVAIDTEGIRACAAVPMRADGDALGVCVLARVGGDPLDAALRQTLHSIGVQLGHFAERRTAERRLREETVAVAAVARATRQLAALVDRRHAAQALCEAALEICEASYAFLAVPDPESDGLVMEAVAPAVPDGFPEPVRFERGSPSLTLRVFDSGEALFLPDVTQDPDADVESAEQAGVTSGLLQPILHDGETLGVLGLAWQSRVPRLERSIHLLVRLLADEAAMALSRAELFRRLETAARTDPLTGLANIRAWEEQLGRELAAARRDGRAVAVAVLDLDGFKRLNDERGHQHGDRVLRTAAAGWLAQLRQGDMLARLGGDEFAALLPGCRPDDALRLAERLRAATSEVTVSIGVAYWNGDEAPGSLRERADTALYAAKAAGRDRVSTG